MLASSDHVLSLALGLLALAYVLIALIRGKVHGLRHTEGWTMQVYTPADIFTFPLILSILLTLSALLTLVGFDQVNTLTSRYLLFSGLLALIARSLAIMLVSYVVVFFLSQVRRLFER